MSHPGARRAPTLAPLLTLSTLALITACSTSARRAEPGPAFITAPPTAVAPAAVNTVSAAALEPRLATATAPLLLDVRTPAEYSAGHLPGARLIPHDQLAQRLAELASAKDREVIVYCRSGRRAAQAIDTLTRGGFSRVAHLQGDYLRWSAEGRRVATGALETTAPSN